MAENSRPTNIERLSDLIDLEVQDGEEVQIEEPMETGEGDIAVELSEEGAQIDFFPDEEIIDTTPFDANLAEYVDEGELGRIAYQLITDYEEDKGSRHDWEDAYVRGLDLSLIHI